MHNELCLSHAFFLSSRLIHWSLILTQGSRVKLATVEHKTHRSDVDTGGYTALDFALHDSHVLNANVFMQPPGAYPGGCSGFSSTPLLARVCLLTTVCTYHNSGTSPLCKVMAGRVEPEVVSRSQTLTRGERVW